jgi:hypothetical protein
MRLPRGSRLRVLDASGHARKRQPPFRAGQVVTVANPTDAANPDTPIRLTEHPSHWKFLRFEPLEPAR